ncbi:MAG: peptide chain release factor N(5)-glutamine methyltransferase [Parcubacteria group bacterium]|jgi:release factor glutamine methyltransferase
MKKKNSPRKSDFRLPPFEQELILAHILQKSREYVLTHLYPVTKITNKKTKKYVNGRKNIKKFFGDGAEISLNKAQKAKFDSFISRRKSHEPLAYILGHKEFYGLDFKVDKNTLIPRPETELLVEEIIKLNPKNINVIDIGTGSGNIIISLAANKKQRTKNDKINYYATDISLDALVIARKNAKKYNLQNKIKFIKTDLIKYFIDHCSLITGRCIIVANLPYLSKKIYNSTLPDVKNFEPGAALLSGRDGLDHYERLFIQIENIIRDTRYKIPYTILEISPEQKNKIEKMAKKYLPKCKINFIKDLSGRWRVAKIEL